jgi:conjugal transfer/type IV secretion protein DotA/TraY
VKNKIMKALGALAVFLLPALAFAQTAAQQAGDISYAVPAGDKYVAWLLIPLFGSLVDSASGPGALGAVMSIWNGAALLFGGLLAAYTMLAGTMQTAHDGEMLGKRWSSIWIPIRTSIGTALAVPMSSGFCAAQMFVIWVALQGVGLADSMWSTFVMAYTNPAVASSSFEAPQLETLAHGMLRSQICMQELRVLGSGGDTSTVYPDGTQASASGVLTAERGGMRSYGTPLTGRTSCGAVSWTPSTSKDIGTYLGSTPTRTPDSSPLSALSNSGFVRTNTAQQAVVKAHATAFSALESEMSQIAAKILDPEYKPTDANVAAIRSRYATAISAYKMQVVAAAQYAVADPGYWAATSQAMTQDGWSLAGVFFSRLTAIRSATAGALDAVPKHEPSSTLDSVEDVKGAYAKMSVYIQPGITGNGEFGPDMMIKADLTRAAGIASQQLSDGDPGFFASKIYGFMESMSGLAFKKFATWVTDDPDASIQSAKSPIVTLQAFGQSILSFLTATIAIILPLLLMPGVGTALTGLLMTVAAPLTAALVGLTGLGIFAAVVIPALPAIIFTAGVFGCALMTFEAVVAAPLASVMHLQPDGDGITGGAANGYWLVLNLFFAPALKIFGFICALLIMTPASFFLNKVIMATVAGTLTGSGMASFLMLVGFIGLYVYAQFKLISWSLSLTHTLPAQIMRWMGGISSMGSIGDASREMGGITSKPGAAGGAVMGAVMGAMTGGGKGKGGKGPGGKGPDGGAGERTEAPMPKDGPDQADTAVSKAAEGAQRIADEAEARDGIEKGSATGKEAASEMAKASRGDDTAGKAQALEKSRVAADQLRRAYITAPAGSQARKDAEKASKELSNAMSRAWKGFSDEPD